MKTLEEAMARIAVLEKENDQLAKDSTARIRQLEQANDRLAEERDDLKSRPAKPGRSLFDEAGEKLLAAKMAAGLSLETALEVVKAQQANDAQKKKTAKA